MQASRTHQSETAREPQRHESLAQLERSRTVARGCQQNPEADRVRTRGAVRPPLTRGPQRCAKGHRRYRCRNDTPRLAQERDKFREIPIPRDFATTIQTVDDIRDTPTSSARAFSRKSSATAVTCSRKSSKDNSYSSSARGSLRAVDRAVTVKTVPNSTPRLSECFLSALAAGSE